MSRHQNPDDFICKPTQFIEYREDNTPIKTFGVVQPWGTQSGMPIGCLVVWESMAGPLISITLEKPIDDSSE